jgi:hypothetical protein
LWLGEEGYKGGHYDFDERMEFSTNLNQYSTSKPSSEFKMKRKKKNLLLIDVLCIHFFHGIFNTHFYFYPYCGDREQL